MKHVILTLVLLVTLNMYGQTTGQVLIEVSGFSNDKGVCRACLFNTKESFDGRAKPLACIQVAISGKKTVFTFSSVPAGFYAVSLFHDANNNNKLDKNFLGIPKEGYGASKNKLPFASAPSFEDNKFEVKKERIILSLRLRYL